MLAKWLVFAGAALGFLIGAAHLFFTFFGSKLTPRDADLAARLKASSLVLTTEISIWNAWIGFNAAFALGAMLFGAVYGYLALAQTPLLFGSAYLAGLGGLFLTGLVVIARRYWFSNAFRGVLAATICYFAGLVSAWA